MIKPKIQKQVEEEMKGSGPEERKNKAKPPVSSSRTDANGKSLVRINATIGKQRPQCRQTIKH